MPTKALEKIKERTSCKNLFATVRVRDPGVNQKEMENWIASQLGPAQIRWGSLHGYFTLKDLYMVQNSEGNMMEFKHLKLRKRDFHL